jgi:glycosyltransferase involved in cell wall biosynthesis
LICPFLNHDWGRFFLHEIESAGVPVTTFSPDSSLDSLPYEGHLASAIRELGPRLQDVGGYVAALLAERPLVAHFWLDESNVKGGLAASALGVPRIILGLRSLPPFNFHHIHQPYMREAYRWLARQPNVQLVNNSTAGARAYEDWLGLPHGAIRVVHNGFAFEQSTIVRHLSARGSCRSQLGISAESMLVGTVMRLSEEKRPFLWLDIAAAVSAVMPDAQFVIVGDGVLRGELEKRVKTKGLDAIVHLVGHKRDALSWISAMDLFLLTSRVEGLPNVLVEAQAVGVPVVTTNVGGAAETMSHSRTGWLLQSDDPRSAAEIIVKLLRDQPWLLGARKEGPVFVAEAFGIDRMLDETLAMYGDGLPSPTAVDFA